jgi:hypothetical protein
MLFFLLKHFFLWNRLSQRMYTRNVFLVFALAFLYCFLVASAQAEDFAWTKSGTNIVVSIRGELNLDYNFSDANVLKAFLQQLSAFKTFTFDTRQNDAWTPRTFKLADGSLIAITSVVAGAGGGTHSVQVAITPPVAAPAFEVTKELSITSGRPITFHGNFRGQFDLDDFDNVVLMRKPLGAISGLAAGIHYYRFRDGTKEYIVHSTAADAATISMRPYAESLISRVTNGVIWPLLSSVGISLLAIYCSAFGFMYFDNEAYRYGLKTSAVLEYIPMLNYLLPGQEEDESGITEPFAEEEDDSTYSSNQPQHRHKGPGASPAAGEKLSDVGGDAAMVFSLLTLLVPFLLL